MRARWAMCIALLVLYSAAARPVVGAQTPMAGERDLQAILRPGMTVWITDAGGREEKTRIIGVCADLVTTTIDGDVRHLPTSEVVRVRARHFDPVINGAVIGAGIAVASGLGLCSLTETWDNCRDDVGPMLRIGAVGAAIGIGIDALIRGRRTIYEPGRGHTRLRAAPIVARHARGLQVSVRF